MPGTAPALFYMKYTIYTNSVGEYDSWLANYVFIGGAGGVGVPIREVLPDGRFTYGILLSPQRAATLLGLPYPPSGAMGSHGILLQYPYVPDGQIGFPAPGAATISDTDNSFTAAPNAGIGGNNGLFVWEGVFILIPAATGTVTMPQRNWIEGFETPARGDTNVTIYNAAGRDSSRATDGIGLAWRSTAGQLASLALDALGGSATQDNSWERFYFRIRQLTTGAEHGIWRCHSNGGSGAEGIELRLSSTGQLRLFRRDNAGTATLVTSLSTLTTGIWHRIDLLIKYIVKTVLGVTSHYVEYSVYIDTVLVATGDTIVRSGATPILYHGSSELGNTTATANDAEYDYDDWKNAPQPTVGIAVDLTGLDFVNGCHMQRIAPMGDGPLRSGWVGDWRVTAQYAQHSAANPSGYITSSTPNAVMDVTTNAQVGSAIDQLGAASAIIEVIGTDTTGATHQLGYSFVDAAPVYQSISAFANKEGKSVMYRPAGLSTPDPIYPVRLLMQKANNSSADQIAQLSGIVEYLGTFGLEDISPDDVTVAPLNLPSVGIHNAPYVPTIWSTGGPPPLANVVCEFGTYVGNGTGQTIPLSTLPHWIHVRQTDTVNGGWRWWSTMLGPHVNLQREVDAWLMPQPVLDQVLGTAGFMVTGNDASNNQSGKTYAYVAVSDPGARYLLNAACSHGSAVTTAINTLIDSGFTPEAMFAWQEQINSNSLTAALWYKGAGHQVDGGSVLNAAETTTNVATFAAGRLTTRTNLHSVAPGQLPFSLWRTNDGLGLGGVVVQIMTYTGDGTGARTIDLTPSSGRRPGFGMVVPMNGAAYFRDPLHTGSNSGLMSLSGALSTTAITGGGIDQIIVGATLNALGIVYSVFVIPSTLSACNNGWGCTGVVYPVPTAPGPGTQWTAPQTVDGGGVCNGHVQTTRTGI